MTRACAQALPVSVRAKANLLALLPTEGGVDAARLMCRRSNDSVSFPLCISKLEQLHPAGKWMLFLSDKVACLPRCQFVTT